MREINLSQGSSTWTWDVMTRGGGGGSLSTPCRRIFQCRAREVVVDLSIYLSSYCCLVFFVHMYLLRNRLVLGPPSHVSRLPPPPYGLMDRRSSSGHGFRSSSILHTSRRLMMIPILSLDYSPCYFLFSVVLGVCFLLWSLLLLLDVGKCEWTWISGLGSSETDLSATSGNKSILFLPPSLSQCIYNIYTLRAVLDRSG